MARSKSYKASHPSPKRKAERTEDRSRPPAFAIADYVLAGGRQALVQQHITLEEWLGKGIDEWVWATLAAFKSVLRSGYVQAETVVQWHGSMKHFFEYLLVANAGRPLATPQELTPAHIEGFIRRVRLRYQNRNSARSRFTSVKSSLVSLIDLGYIKDGRKELFPANPFPGRPGEEGTTGETALSQNELQRLASALKSDIADLHHGRLELPPQWILTELALVLAVRSGMNTTPLRELKTDCLQPGLLPGFKTLVGQKYRGRSTYSTPVRQSELNEQMRTIRMDGVAIVNRVLQMTAELRPSAPAGIRDFLWLYRDEATGSVKHLSPGTMEAGIKALVKRHGLMADSGERLRLNVSRLRKTMTQTLWRLSDGDILAVASALGNTPNVADRSYLRIDESGKAEAAIFIGSVLSDELRNSSGVTPTPAGACQSTMHGARAPKDGTNHCDQFTDCLSCPSYAIVGSVPDLYRLFSFQEFLRIEISNFEGEEWSSWRQRHEHWIGEIDRVTDKHFRPDVVRDARSMAGAKPHRFWEIRIMQAAAQKGVQ